jgi:catechol 2,3-dioxygenase-like lactoylglutathione lyase family enzyme
VAIPFGEMHGSPRPRRETAVSSVDRVRTFSDLFRNVMQIAYVTDDLDRACDYFEQTLGTVPARKTYKSSLGGIVVVDGETAEEWVMDVALVNAGPTNFELIQPVSGAVDLYRSAIRPGAPATFHHVGYRIDDFDEATAIVHASGKEWKQYGEMKGGLRFGYVDMTAELGHYVEFMDLQAGGERMFASLEAESNAPR